MKVYENLEQGSLEWLKLRCGKITMSHAKALALRGKGWTTCIHEAVADILSDRERLSLETNFTNRNMERGTFLEEYALKAFTAIYGQPARNVGFVFQDDERIGCSPDALLPDEKLVEIKCPQKHIHAKNAFGNGMSEYEPQAQGNMWVCECESAFIVSFCPWMEEYPIAIKEVFRDEPYIEKLSAASIEAADMVERIVNDARNNASFDSVKQIAEQAKLDWESILLVDQHNGEIEL